MKNRKSNF